MRRQVPARPLRRARVIARPLRRAGMVARSSAEPATSAAIQPRRARC